MGTVQKYICNNCGRESNKFFGVCPTCGKGIGELTEIEANIDEKEIISYNPKLKEEIKRVNSNAGNTLHAKIKTKFNSFNNVLSSASGFISGQVVLLGAKPGVGKSTLCCQISDENTLYISSEESYEQVNSRMLRVNPTSNARILSTTSISNVLQAINETECEFIIIDSINSIEFGVGYQTTANFVFEITNKCKELNKICIIISQVNRDGEITGMMSIPHIVDTVLYIEQSEVSSNILVTSSKNRYGEIGSVASFVHGPNGLVESDLEEKFEQQIGVTYNEIRLGYKKLFVAIESLVTKSNAMYGLRKSNGYNNNRLIQLVGVIQNYANINLQYYDIYIALSSGLTSNEVTTDLAVANSILSSLYNTSKCVKAYGEVRLSGKIINGYISIDGDKNQNINHINELIKLYREGREDG